MKIYDANNQELMTVREIAREGDNLVIRGKIFGAMPMAAILTPKEARAAFKLLDFKTMIFMISMLFRRR
jgi:hypothetical protein